MDLHQLRCFEAAADELHFGRAARRLGMMPSALGRHIRLLEEDLGTRLLARSTRHVALTGDGEALLVEARGLLAEADRVVARFRLRGRDQAATLRLGAIDSAAAGLVPPLLRDFRLTHPTIAVRLVEDKTIRLLPRLLSGRLDLAFVRPPAEIDRRVEVLMLCHETAVVAVPARHPLARRAALGIRDLAEEPLIVPERRSRPHSHDLTTKLFAQAGLRPNIAEQAEEKHTIVNLVAAGLGIAIVPRWTSRMAARGVCYIPLDTGSDAATKRLPLAAAWPRDTRDAARDAMLDTLRQGLAGYAEQA
jgi:DNA-binding transcriptional LysR family regulator